MSHGLNSPATLPLPPKKIDCYLFLNYSSYAGRNYSEKSAKTCSTDRHCISNYFANISSVRENDRSIQQPKYSRNYSYGISSNESINDFGISKSDLHYFFDLIITSKKCAVQSAYKWEGNVATFCHTVCANVSQTCRGNHVEVTLPRLEQSHISFFCLVSLVSAANLTLLENNSIYVNKTNEIYQYGEYERLDDGFFRVCHFQTSWTPEMWLVSRIFRGISILSLSLHLFIFVVLRKRRNTPSKNLASLSTALLINELFISIFFEANENQLFCRIMSVLTYYFVSASIIWSNVLSIDICRTFCSNLFKVKPHELFVKYSVYGWGFSFVLTVFAYFVDEFAPKDFILNPDFGSFRCFFNNKWGFVAFCTFPSLLILFINAVLFSISVVSICRQDKKASLASSNTYKSQLSTERSSIKLLRPAILNESSLNEFPDRTKPCTCRKVIRRFNRKLVVRRRLRMRLFLYLKLAFIMGLSWNSAFLSIHTKLLVFEYMHLTLNGLLGTFIFLAFDCKKHIMNDLLEKLCRRKRPLSNLGASSSGRRSYSVDHPPISI